VRLAEKAAEHCVLRPPGSKLIVCRRSPGTATIAAAAGQRES
jgi:hypothetical protein